MNNWPRRRVGYQEVRRGRGEKASRKGTRRRTRRMRKRSRRRTRRMRKRSRRRRGEKEGGKGAKRDENLGVSATWLR